MKLSLIVSTIMLIPMMGFAISQDSYWENTDVNDGMLFYDEGVSPTNCEWDLFQFRGCIKAAQAIAQRMSPGHEVWPKALVSQPHFPAGNWVRDLNSDFALYSVKMDLRPLTAYAIHQETRRIRAMEDKFLRELFKEYTAKKRELPSLTAMVSDLLNSPEVPASRRKAILAGAITAFGREATHDAHAQIVPTQAIKDLQKKSGSNKVLGADLYVIRGQVIITGIEAGGPADAAGLKPNDILIQVGAQGLVGFTGQSSHIHDFFERQTQAVSVKARRFRNQQAQTIETNVRLTEKQTDKMDLRFEKYFGEEFLIIQLKDFMRMENCTEADQALRALKTRKQVVRGVIIDVRGNPGGYVELSQCLASLFMGRGIVSYAKSTIDEGFEEMRGAYNKATDLPVALLQDSTSASASEILAQALRAHQRGWIVGEKSFGKGSMQSADDLTRSVMMLRTVGVLYGPRKDSHQLYGVLPDFKVDKEPGLRPEDAFRFRESELFPNSPNPGANPSAPNRIAQIQNIEKCRNSERVQRSLRGAPASGDFVTASAAEILICDKEQTVGLNRR